MPVTTPDSIFYPDVSVPASEIANLGTMATSIQAALALRSRFDYVWANTAARTAQVGMVAGARGYQIDTGYDYKYNGSAWRNTTVGMVPVIPSSVSGTGITVGPSGIMPLVSATGTLQINGIFTSEFENYRMEIGITSSTANMTILGQLSNGGTPVTTAKYDNQSLTGSNLTASAGTAFGTTSWTMNAGSSATNRAHWLELNVKQPALAIQTTILMNAAAYNNPQTTSSAISQKLLTQQDATIFDGFCLTISVGTTGTTGCSIRVYGYNNLTN